MHHPTDKITHTTAFGTPVVEHWLEREIAREREREKKKKKKKKKNYALYLIIHIQNNAICMVLPSLMQNQYNQSDLHTNNGIHWQSVSLVVGPSLDKGIQFLTRTVCAYHVTVTS